MEQRQPQEKKLRIRTLGRALLAAAAVLGVCLIAASVYMAVRYQGVRDAVDGLAEKERCCAAFGDGSACLTLNARAYVSTGDSHFLKEFFEELNVTRRRGTAVAELETLADGAVTDEMHAALAASEQLLAQEEYAIRLVASALGETQLPLALQSVALREADEALSADEKLAAGRSMLYAPAYDEIRASLEAHVANARTAMQDGVDTRLRQNGASLRRTAAALCVLTVLSVLVTAAALWLLNRLILRPLRVYVRCVREERLVRVSEIFEMGSVSLAYDDVFALERANALMVSEEAQRDALTGLIAHDAFEGLQRLLASKPEPMALLVADIEGFGDVNETHGREVGDRLLQRVAKLLTLSFRSSDYVVRLSGDEFAVVLTDMPAELQGIVVRKVSEINEELQAGRDGLPPVALSVGAAFSPAGFAEDLYQKADLALYEVKESGRGGCSIHTA